MKSLGPYRPPVKQCHGNLVRNTFNAALFLYAEGTHKNLWHLAADLRSENCVSREIRKRKPALKKSSGKTILHREPCLHFIRGIWISEIVDGRPTHLRIDTPHIIEHESVLLLQIAGSVDHTMRRGATRMEFGHQSPRFYNMALVPGERTPSRLFRATKQTKESL